MIIAFTGYQRTGKSTAAKYLEDKYHFSRLNMKDALIREMEECFPDLLQEMSDHYGMTIDDLFTHKPPLMRALMQNFGTEVRRKQNPEYWTNEWKKRSYANDSIVVDDVRFLNEAEAVRSRGGIIVRIKRSDITTGGSHSSETEQDSIKADYTIDTTKGDFENLQKELDAIVLPLAGKK